MTDKQKRFADEYLIDCNATRAYKVAYPHTKNDNVAKSAGNRLLTFVDIKTYIDERLKAISNDKIATADEVMKYLTSVMRGEEKDEKVIESELYKIQVQTKERLKAAELLGKRFGLDKAEEDTSELRKLDEVLEKIKGVI